MNRRRYVLVVLCLSLIGIAKLGGAQNVDVYTPTWESVAQHYQAPDWFRDAKLGIYTHWGPVTVGAEDGPGGVQWYGRNMYQKKSPTFDYHRQKYGDPNEVGYKDMIAKFNPQRFDAEQWAQLFAESGARFAGPVAIHHDNYAMWDSAFTRWDSMDTAPKRDFTAELEKALRKRGMKFIATFHHAFSWEYFDGAYAYDGADPQYADLYGEKHKPGDAPTERHLKVWLDMVNEVVDKYEPDLIWFDFGLGKLIPEPYQLQMFADYYNRAARQGRQVGVAHKHWNIHAHAGIIDFERGRMDRSTEFPWLTDTSVGPWFHQKSHAYKTPNQLIDVLVDIVSKNGCMLLNVGPTAAGEIPAEAQNLLRALGRWLQVNGEAIYATRPWLIHGEGPTHMEQSGGFSENKDREYTARDIRYTQSKDGKTLYALALDRPGSEMTLGFVEVKHRAPDAKITLLGSTQNIPYRVNSKGQPVLDLSGAQVKELKGKYAFAFRLQGFKVALHAQARFSLPGAVTLEPGKATLEGEQIKTQENEGRENIGYWNRADTKVHWLVKTEQPGTWQIRGEFSCAAGASELSVSLAGQKVKAVIPRTDGWFKPVWVNFGQVTIKQAGVYHLVLEPTSADAWKPVNVYQLQLAQTG